MTKAIVDISKLKEVFGKDLDLFLFYITWIKNGLNASKTYKELHPNVDDHSARVLGSRELAKVNKEQIMSAYSLDHELYFQQLREGLNATKWNDFTGEREADHKTRKDYHDKLGKLLGLEKDKSTVGAEFKDGDKQVRFIITRGEE